MEIFQVAVTVPVAWGEMDALGHVNNTRFFAWMESARIALFRQVGVIGAATGGIGPVLRATSCEFLRPVVFPANVRVGARVSRVGTSSLQMDYAITLEGDGAPVVVGKGTSTAVIIDFATGKPVPIPDAIRDAIAKLESPP